jgi:hypothetical protein
MGFTGGSAYAMANSLMDGFLIPSPTTLKRLSNDELRTLKFEVEKLLRDLRGTIPDQSDGLALQRRNQKLQKLQGALSVLDNYLGLRLKGRA